MSATRVDLFDSTYRHFASEVLTDIRREAFGDDIGQNSWLTLDEYDRFIAWLNLRPDEHVLEVACGSGGPARYLAQQTDCRVCGLDSNEYAVGTATRMGTQDAVTFIHADANDPLPFANGEFDAVVCVDSMNHFPNRLSVLWEWHRVMRSGARAVFTDPVVVTGPVTNEQFAIRSSIGTFVFVPQDVNEQLIELAGFRLILQQDVTSNAALVAGRWYRARERHRNELLSSEGRHRFEGLQEFFATVHRLASERRLSRIAYLVEKPATT
ncbi:ubiquinone/menaquinone biosynthesis C-methylase UbiE [Povalibacter uvarum]|uniref:Ubiquinone/menaquinone biosynthesis C-methylase UbiE n=1 Tax=Povalibacter uvarum TaxID=732238 RepID=A0A841HTT6_9GAMM|nr:class I SAM-dependent methyltransferase [Povalibacter uvarum]MBB6096316.1 ubiquinone/menaquinone biosynthesis C-methylase UbiE [Povalibacter uvarum]